MMMLAFAGFTMAQTIENFESLPFTIFSNGSTGKMGVLPNPDPTGINTSVNVGMMVRAKDGNPWQGFFHDFSPTIDVTANKYLHLKLWKPRKSPIVLKYEAAGDPNAATTPDIHPMTAQADSNKWEEFVFDMTAYTGTVLHRLTIIPDFPSAVGLTADINIYFDDIYLNNDPTVGSAPVKVLENFETIPMHPYSEEGTFTLIENPDMSGINQSSMVGDFMRPTTAPDWAGFYSLLAASGYDSVDVTTKKFVHVKAWKPRISLVKFKLQDGVAGTKEIASMNAQVKIKDWEDYVFDFRDKTGKYPIIGLSLDAGADALAADIHIYFDDIMVSNDSTQLVNLTLNVDMHGSGLKATDTVYVAGTFPGWVKPGADLSFRMTDPDGDSIYSLTMVVPAGHKEFKFFKNAGWDGGEWAGGANRMIELAGDDIANCVWGQAGFVGNRENAQANKIQMYPNPVRNELNIRSTADVSRIIITNTLGKVVGNINYTGNQTINTSNFSRGMYFVTFVDRDGNKVTQKLIKN